ncbi:MAG: hypothetical protein ABR540_19920 [Acidimicrobiales bacterium]
MARFRCPCRPPYYRPVPSRYRCTACGNLTRFDVTTARTTRAFHHFSLGGELTVEEEQVLDEVVQSVTCRWCGSSEAVETL